MRGGLGGAEGRPQGETAQLGIPGWGGTEPWLCPDLSGPWVTAALLDLMGAMLHLHRGSVGIKWSYRPEGAL